MIAWNSPPDPSRIGRWSKGAVHSEHSERTWNFLQGNSSGIQIHLHCMFAGREKAMKNAFAFLLLLAISAFGQSNRVIPKGAEIKVRTDSAIPTKPAVRLAHDATVRHEEHGSS